MIAESIARIADGHDLSREEARSVMNVVMEGEATPAQIGGLLVGLRAKGETVDEITGFAEALREHVVPVSPTRTPLVDVVGTGGDGAHTFNISTAAALVAAAAGAAVAKHGNRAASSACGSADVLEALGFALELPPERIAASIDEHGFGFMFARAHHPAMRHAAPVRQELGTRTVFNVLGPLANPAGARDGVFGVYAAGARAHLRRGARRPRRAPGARRPRRRRRRRAHALRPLARRRGAGRARSRNGSSTPPPSASRAPTRAELRGGDATDNAATIRRVLAGERGARRDAVVLNAGAALVAAGVADDLREGVAAAAAAIDDGRGRGDARAARRSSRTR